MKVELIPPKMPPPEIRLTFSIGEGWAIVAALRDYAAAHPNAAGHNAWRLWADVLDGTLRR